jgi:hypothetical protein
MTPLEDFPSASRSLRTEVTRLLKTLKPGTRIKITQTVRVGSTAKWTTQVQGVFRKVDFLATGLATQRVPEDDIVVVMVHFTKDNGELSSVALDEHSLIEVVPTVAAS